MNTLIKMRKTKLNSNGQGVDLLYKQSSSTNRYGKPIKSNTANSALLTIFTLLPFYLLPSTAFADQKITKESQAQIHLTANQVTLEQTGFSSETQEPYKGSQQKDSRSETNHFPFELANELSDTMESIQMESDSLVLQNLDEEISASITASMGDSHSINSGKKLNNF